MLNTKKTYTYIHTDNAYACMYKTQIHRYMHIYTYTKKVVKRKSIVLVKHLGCFQVT